MQLQLKSLFAIDTFSLLLFAMSILGILGHLPAITNIIIQTLYVGITLLLTFCFICRRNVAMAVMKLSMLFILFYMNATIYYI